MFTNNNQFLQKETSQTTCDSLLSELQTIWDEVGESSSERDKMLVQLEQECLEAYKRRVDQASHNRNLMRQAVAESRAELAIICSAIGERMTPIKKFVQGTGSLKRELEAIMPELKEMRKRKVERLNQFAEVVDKIYNISKELYISDKDYSDIKVMDESDLSLKTLDGLKSQLHDLEKEKSDRLKLVLDLLNTLNSLCVVLGVDFQQTVRDVQLTLDDSSSKNYSVDTVERLSTAVSNFKEVKIQRLQKLQDLAATMVDLWSLMDTPFEEQERFHSVTKHIAASVDEINEPNILSPDFISFAEAEVLRLQQIKSCKMKEVICKKRLDLEDRCRKAHMIAEANNAANYSVEAIASGTVDPSYLLEQIELQISKVKEEAFSRKDILEKVDKWLAACEEECWLEEYNRDDNRYNSGRGTHLVLRRAEEARVVVNKIPAMVEALLLKIRAWELDRRTEFLYDGVPLTSMLEQYNTLRQEKEQDRQRQRDQKKLHRQLLAKQEVLFGSKPSPVTSGNKGSRTNTREAMNKRCSHVGDIQQTPMGRTAKSSQTVTSSYSAKQHSLQNQPSGGYGASSSGKRSLRVTSLLDAQHPSIASNARETRTTREPLSPANSSILSANSAANIQFESIPQCVVLDRTPPSKKIPLAISQKSDSSINENKTPEKMPIPVPTTPSTLSVAMRTAATPATPFLHIDQETECSFEERRAGVVLSETSKAH
ncbi:65-kDa microtubule-associated protein 3-like isoform X1 [Apium graveolens]|uniref:65-kDa microtubule-associated protein 3-like isoform X1 n=1 Tax=Apium graveolens TaxID=4045 RepID=UPI003D797B64